MSCGGRNEDFILFALFFLLLLLLLLPLSSDLFVAVVPLVFAKQQFLTNRLSTVVHASVCVCVCVFGISPGENVRQRANGFCATWRVGTNF